MNFLKNLNKVLPFYLVLIINYPLLAGLVINPPLVTPRLVMVNLLWLSFFVLIYRLFKSITVYRFFVILLSAIAIIETLNWVFQKGPFSSSGLFIISATNMGESEDFLKMIFGIHFLFILPLIFLIYKAWKHIPDLIKTKFTTYSQIALMLVFTIFLADNILHDRFVRLALPNFPKTLINFNAEMKLYKETKGRGSLQKVDAVATEEQQTIVLILGESSNRNHWGLYGAKVNTTPKLQQRNDLYFFDNVVSAYSRTIGSVMISLSERALDNDIKENEGVDIFDVFHSAGYETYWISNQSPLGVWENVITLLAQKSDHPTFVNLASTNSFESTLMRSYDEVLFDPTEKALKTDSPLKFIVIHTMGNHSSYSKRYPSEFAQFKGNDSKSQTIAEYHNSILYHDYFLDSILKIIEENTTNSVVVYASDHGENVYDEKGQLGHGYSGKMPKSNVEIPFSLWFSDDYKKGIDLNLVQNRLNAPYVTDHLFYSLIDLARIKTPLLLLEKSITNDKFDASRKRILRDGYDYDE